MRAWGVGAILSGGTIVERDLVQLVYVSDAAAEMTTAELDRLAESAQDRSAGGRLTGLLLHHGRHYYAVIEGPRRRVFERIEEIIAEQGNRGVRILREESIATRRFTTWSYGVVPTGGRDGGGPSEFLWRYCGLRSD